MRRNESTLRVRVLGRDRGLSLRTWMFRDGTDRKEAVCLEHWCEVRTKTWWLALASWKNPFCEERDWLSE